MSEIKLYPTLYPIRYLLGAVGGALLVVTLTWSDAPLKSKILAAIAGLVLITVTFALKHEHLKIGNCLKTFKGDNPPSDGRHN